MYPITQHKKIIVIGGNAAGPAAAAKAKRAAPDAAVTMIECGNYISTGTCELPYVLSGEIKNYNDIVFFNADSFEKEKGVKVLTSHLVEKIDRRRKIVSVKNLNDGQKFELEYDRIILCTGSRAKRLPALPKILSNVFSLKSVSDLILIKNYLAQNKVNNVLVVGAGYIGLETADALKTLGYNVTVLEKEKLALPEFENETRHLLNDHLIQNGIEFIGGATEVKYKHDEQKFISIKYEGRITEYDLVLLSIGVEPNNDLAVSSQLAIGKLGGIKVDQKLRTNDPNIFAAGDCIEVINKITGKPDFIPLANIAHLAGHATGDNAAGGNTIVQPFVKNIAVKLFGKSLTSVGLNSNQAKNFGFNFAEVHTVIPNLVKVMPDSNQVFGKILFDKNSKLILGANFFGGNEVVGYADIISTMIYNKIKVTELAGINFNYTPPLSPFINILSVLGRKIEREIK